MILIQQLARIAPHNKTVHSMNAYSPEMYCEAIRGMDIEVLLELIDAEGLSGTRVMVVVVGSRLGSFSTTWATASSRARHQTTPSIAVDTCFLYLTDLAGAEMLLT